MLAAAAAGWKTKINAPSSSGNFIGFLCLKLNWMPENVRGAIEFFTSLRRARWMWKKIYPENESGNHFSGDFPSVTFSGFRLPIFLTAHLPWHLFYFWSFPLLGCGLFKYCALGEHKKWCSWRAEIMANVWLELEKRERERGGRKWKAAITSTSTSGLGLKSWTYPYTISRSQFPMTHRQDAK